MNVAARRSTYRAARSSAVADSNTSEMRAQSVTFDTSASYLVESLYQMRCAFLMPHDAATSRSPLAATTCSPYAHSSPIAPSAPS